MARIYPRSAGIKVFLLLFLQKKKTFFNLSSPPSHKSYPHIPVAIEYITWHHLELVLHDLDIEPRKGTLEKLAQLRARQEMADAEMQPRAE
jgi:hypothetical protein